ncbi:TlpA family protein disulfide reductase [Owenweeksia hongkongensis]|nr:TlpA disulfide reductase family protein [Owenweeksia hongkongensis]
MITEVISLISTLDQIILLWKDLRMIKRIIYFSAVFSIALGCINQNETSSQDNFEHKVIGDHSGLELEERLKTLIAKKNDSSHIGKLVPSLRAVDIDGNTIAGSNLSSVVFYNFWFTGCPPCIAEIPWFNKLAGEYKGRVDFIAITFENLEDLTDFFEQNPFNFHHYTMDRNEINRLSLTDGFPTTFVAINGRIVYWKAGGITVKHQKFSVEMEKQNEFYRNLIEGNLQ